MKIFVILICLFHNVFGTIDRTWWKNKTMLQVFLPSFMDGNGDGFGDFKGLNSKLDYINELGIEILLMTPFFPCPNMQFAGYDTTDYYEVNPRFGSMDDFDNLIEEMKKRGLKLIIDMVINHSGDKHPWFTKSVNREHPYTDYYIWKNPKGYDNNGNPIPPNNWYSVTGGSAWEWNSRRRQYYLHQFVGQMPDLNLRNSYVLNEIRDIIEFWSDKGVAGFRLDAAEHFVEDAQFRNEPPYNLHLKDPQGRDAFDHMFTLSTPESFELIHKLRTYQDHLSERSGDFERILIPETHCRGRGLYQNYGTEKWKLAHFPFNFLLTYTNQYENAYYYRNAIDGYLSCLPDGAIANWNSENHDSPRRAEVFNEEYEFILTTMVLLLPGVATLYYGQELGLAGWHFWDRNVDSWRLPMQWDDTKNAGFTTNSEPYIPVSPNYPDYNVKKQKAEENSHYNKVKKMISWRKTEVFKYGSFKSYVVSDWVYSFTRRLENKIYLVVFNLGKDTEFVDLKQAIDNLPRTMMIKLASRNSDYNIGNEINIDQKFRVKPQTVAVLYPKGI